ncbi:MAG: DNA-binding transcriptional regulator [Kiritimatiellae bacterium]|jgi:LacI family transcriptional regulator|nr:DNA-binding transcriptional regulator [Kiritimatiellia bacterium]
MNQIRTRMHHVALLLPPTSIKACRELLRGVLRFAHLHGPWTVHMIDKGVRASQRQPFDPVTWECTGMIVNVRDRKNADRLLATGIPAILLNVPDDCLKSSHPYSRMCRLQCENKQIGIKAAEYFLDRKFCNFAFVGTPDNAMWSEVRMEAICDRLGQSGYACHVYPRLSAGKQQSLAKEQERLIAWLIALPKPIALFAANDERGCQVLDACLRAGMDVPQQIAVLGVDNDELVCETAHPPMSSIQMSPEHAGFEAASTLDQLMRNMSKGTCSHPKVISYGFSQLVTRRSTQVSQVDDPLVARAEEYIHINAGIGITVEVLAKKLLVSRRWLEKRYKTVMGRTLYTGIMCARLARVQALLLETSMTVESIAFECGFSSVSHMGTHFRRHFNTTPSAFRRQIRNNCN